MVMGRDVPQVLEGKVKVDARYSTGKASRRFPKRTDPSGKHRTGIAHPPIYGIWYSQGKVWASLLREAEANDFLPLLRDGTVPNNGTAVDTDSGYSGIAYNGRIYRMNDTAITEDLNASSTDNGLYNFGDYLTKRLASRRGIRRDRLPLYLAECVWRFNHREAPVPRQEEKLLDLLHRY
jgi:transposase-like protein